MIRAVADTNVYISALMFGGLPEFFLDLAFARAFMLFVSEAILGELEEKLRGKFAVAPEDAHAIRTKLENTAHVIEPDCVLNLVEDDPDYNRVLECAVAARAEFLVTGDRHLLRLGSHAGISILTVRRFIDVAFVE